MPFYPNLQIRANTSESLKTKRIRTAKNLQNLRSALSDHFEESGTKLHNAKSVRIGTWNLREFGKPNYRGRGFEELYYMAEIISQFDIMALQEIRGDLKEFKNLLQILGPDWCYIATDVTDGNAGNGERMVFVYNERKADFKHIAGELTLEEQGKITAAFGERIKLQNGIKVILPEGVDLSGTYPARLKDSGTKLDRDLEIPLPAKTLVSLPQGCSLVVAKNSSVTSPGRGKATVNLDKEIKGADYRLKFLPKTLDDSFRQFSRTPFIISFQIGWLKINLCTVHIYYGEDSGTKLEQRRSEIELLAKALSKKAEGEFKDDGETFMGVLGDFNIIGKDHPTMKALEDNDFVIPEELKKIPGSNVEKDKAYDQIAFWKPDRVTRYAKLDIIGANVFDFYKYVFKKQDEAIYRAEGPDNGMKNNTDYLRWRTYKMSDHLPMWIELRTDFGDEYLKSIVDSDS